MIIQYHFGTEQRTQNSKFSQVEVSFWNGGRHYQSTCDDNKQQTINDEWKTSLSIVLLVTNYIHLCICQEAVLIPWAVTRNFQIFHLLRSDYERSDGITNDNTRATRVWDSICNVTWRIIYDNCWNKSFTEWSLPLRWGHIKYHLKANRTIIAFVVVAAAVAHPITEASKIDMGRTPYLIHDTKSYKSSEHKCSCSRHSIDLRHYTSSHSLNQWVAVIELSTHTTWWPWTIKAFHVQHWPELRQRRGKWNPNWEDERWLEEQFNSQMLDSSGLIILLHCLFSFQIASKTNGDSWVESDGVILLLMKTLWSFP